MNALWKDQAKRITLHARLGNSAVYTPVMQANPSKTAATTSKQFLCTSVCQK